MSASAFSLLIKPASAVCNLDCGYCFYKRAFEVFPDKSDYVMPDDVLKAMVRKFMATGQQTLGFGWQGGEPTTCGLDFFQRAVAYQQEFGMPGQNVSNSLQTNGILIDDKWAKFLHRYQFLVGLSLDGPKHIHDYYRRFYNGKGSFDRVMEAARTMSDHRVEFNVLTVLNDYNVTRCAEMYEFFLRNGFYFLQFIPCVETGPDGKSILPFSVTAEQYGAFLCELFDLWYKDGFPRVSIRGFDSVLSYLVDGQSLMCVSQRECSSYLVIEHTGEIFPCDFFVYDEWRLGNILEDDYSEIFASAHYRKFRTMKRQLPKACQKCKYLKLCFGDCTKFRLLQGGQPTSLSYFCKAQKMFFDHTLPRFKKLAREVKRIRAQQPPMAAGR